MSRPSSALLFSDSTLYLIPALRSSLISSGAACQLTPFAAALSYGGLKQVADLYNETCTRLGRKPGRLLIE